MNSDSNCEEMMPEIPVSALPRDLHSLSNIQLEKYLDTEGGRADARVPAEILIRLFKARSGWMDEHLFPDGTVPVGYSPITGLPVGLP